MTVNKTKSVEVRLTNADVLEAISQYALRAHPSCKKAVAVVAVDARFDSSDVLIRDSLDASVTFTFPPKEATK